MSSNTRRQIMYWICLAVGIIGLCKQLYSYIIDQLNLTLAEGVITIVFVTIATRPNLLSDSYNKLIDKFTRHDKEQN